MTEKNFHPTYRADIDGLRALAIIPVVAYHAFPVYAPGGFVGVDIFFVISGYLISLIIFKSLEYNEFSLAEFYTHRIKRIFPALLLVTCACYAAGWIFLLPEEFKQLGKHIAAGMGFVENLVLWKEAGYFDNASELKPLMHLWSLAVEEQFYLVYPLFVWILWKVRLNVLAGIVVVGVGSFVLNARGIHEDAIKTFFVPQMRFWELMVGSMLAFVVGLKKLRERSAETAGPLLLANVLAVAGILLIAYSIAAYNHKMAYPGVRAIAPVLGAGLLIFAGPQAWVNRNLLSNKILVWVGLISYPLYLWHWPLLSFVRIVDSETPSSTLRAAAVASSFIFAALTYYLIEKRIRYGHSTRSAVAVLCVLAVTTGIAGYYTYVRNGLSFRFPQVVNELISYKYDFDLVYRHKTCFLNEDQGYENFEKCSTETAQNKSILLWGDAHAAHLYPGYKQRYSGEYSIIQRTASGCPPIMNLEIPSRIHCKKINDYVLQKIEELHPDRVVMSAVWPTYDLANLEETIDALKKIGIGEIEIVGPVPQWSDGLPKQLYSYYRSHVPHIIPERMQSGLMGNFSNLDSELRLKFKNGKVHYISAKDILCNSDGCLTQVGGEGGSLTAWDYAHLTAQGSVYLVSKFPEFKTP